MKKLTLLLAVASIMFASLGATAHATPLLSFNYTFSFVLNTGSGTAGNPNVDPTVTGDITLTQTSGGASTFDPTSLTLNAFTLPIDTKASDNLSVPSFTITSAANTLSFTAYTLSTPSNGTITTQGSAYTSAGDSLKDANGNSYSFSLDKGNTTSDFGYILKSTGLGNTFFSESPGVTYTLQATPEPSSWALALLAVGGFFFLRRRALRA